MTQQTPRAHMAIDCRWLKRSLDPTRRDPYAMSCTHIVREGEDCVGPFLEDVESACGLWEYGGPASNRAHPASSSR